MFDYFNDMFQSQFKDVARLLIISIIDNCLMNDHNDVYIKKE